MANGLASNVITSVAQTIAGRQLQKVSGGLKSLRGNFSGIAGGTSSSRGLPIKNSERSDKFKVKHFSYPSDVDSDPMQGHYIIFNINSLTAATLKAEKRAKDIATAAKKLKAQHNIGGPPNKSLTQSEADNRIAKQLEIDFPPEKKAPAAGQTNRGFGINSMPRTRLDTSIALYMPPSVSVNYGINYAEEEIGSLAEVGIGVIKAFTQGGGDISSKLGGAFKAITGAGAQEGIQTAIVKTLDTFAPGANTLLQMETGKVITPRMEIMFKGVGRRTFSYTFAFIPKSVKEARIVENIIHTFKENMHPEYANPTTRKEMKIPNTFDISYMYQNAENSFLNKISMCFLTTMSVQYGADRFTAYESTSSRIGQGPPPQKSQITLNFTELETLSKQHIKEGY